MMDCSVEPKREGLNPDLVARVKQSLIGQLTMDQAFDLRAELIFQYGLGSETDIPCPDCKKPLIVTYKSAVSCSKENEGCGKTGPDYTFL